MDTFKKQFNITEKKYHFEIGDLTTILTILNVLFVLLKFQFAPIFGLTNCIICSIMFLKMKAHLNNLVTQIALVVLNLYFLNII